MPPTEISSTKQPGYSIATDHILVFEQIFSSAHDVQDGFNQQFPTMLQACGIQAIPQSLPPLANEEGGISTSNLTQIQQITGTAIRQYKADTVLLLVETKEKHRVRTGVRGIATRYEFLASVQTVAPQPGEQGNGPPKMGKKIVWKSSIDLLPENITADGVDAADNPILAGNALASTLYRQLYKDGLLTGCGGQTN